MIASTLTDLITLASNNQRSSDVYVEFLDLPGNISNFLVSRLDRLTPPPIEFETIQHQRPRNAIPDPGRLSKTRITATFTGDDTGLLDMIFVGHVHALLNKKNMTVDMPPRFDIKLSYMKQATNEVQYTVTFKSCFLVNMDIPEVDLSAKEPMIYTVGFEYDRRVYESEILDFVMESYV